MMNTNFDENEKAGKTTWNKVRTWENAEIKTLTD